MQNLNPFNYKIHLEPDLVNFNFSGTTEILLEAQNPVEELTVNILDLAIWSCNVRVENLAVACPFLVNTQNEALRILLPKAMSGMITVIIDYQGKINNEMAGFYRSKYTSGNETKYIAVTQFEESDARRAFPCMDHPAQTARSKKNKYLKMVKNVSFSKKLPKCLPTWCFSGSVNLNTFRMPQTPACT